MRAGQVVHFLPFLSSHDGGVERCSNGGGPHFFAPVVGPEAATGVPGEGAARAQGGRQGERQGGVPLFNGGPGAGRYFEVPRPNRSPGVGSGPEASFVSLFYFMGPKTYLAELSLLPPPPSPFIYFLFYTAFHDHRITPRRYFINKYNG